MKKEATRSILASILSIIIGLVVGCVIILIVGMTSDTLSPSSAWLSLIHISEPTRRS